MISQFHLRLAMPRRLNGTMGSANGSPRSRGYPRDLRISITSVERSAAEPFVLGSAFLSRPLSKRRSLRGYA